MSKPTSILKKQRQNKPDNDRFNESVTDWHQPNDLDLMPIKPMYSPIGTPPKLRTYVIDLSTSNKNTKIIIIKL
jgi:hypothetical protein